MASTYEIRSMIQQTAQQYGVDPNLALAVAQRESSLNPYAQGPAGELGLFQLTPAAAQDVGVDRTTIQGNITGGVLYLRRMLDQFGDEATALAAYNAGPGNVSRGVIPASTRQYVADIEALKAGYAGYPVVAEAPAAEPAAAEPAADVDWEADAGQEQPYRESPALAILLGGGLMLVAGLAVLRSR
jgi:soluble lytic murein transglycosylase-like protein